MKVKIKKEGKTKEYNLINSWEDVTLEKWVKLSSKERSTTKEAEETIAALSDIPKKLIKELSIKDVAVIMSKVAELQAKQDSELKRIIKVEGKEYGFHPDLDSITLGEYADLETFIKNGIEKHLPEVMAVLYRPIVEKKNKIYTIEAYDGNISIRAEEMKKMSAEQVESALRFFFAFVNELAEILPSYLMEKLTKMTEDLQMKALQKDGVGSE
jgi:hypothetical protein|tara:strand:+ start:1255 stop:1893 length:639 start_codon:yes stop_codon:yes gene_type:complete